MLCGVSLGKNGGPCFQIVALFCLGITRKNRVGQGGKLLERKFDDDDDAASMEIMLRLKPEPARLLRATCELDDDTPTGVIHEALKTWVVSTLASGADGEQEMRDTFNDNLPSEENEPHPDTVAIAELTASKEVLIRELFALQKVCNEIQARTFGVSQSVLEGAASYARKHGGVAGGEFLVGAGFHAGEVGDERAPVVTCFHHGSGGLPVFHVGDVECHGTVGVTPGDSRQGVHRVVVGAEGVGELALCALPGDLRPCALDEVGLRGGSGFSLRGRIVDEWLRLGRGE